LRAASSCCCFWVDTVVPYVDTVVPYVDTVVPYVDTVVQYTVKRLSDDQRKEFVIAMEDSATPSIDRGSISCPGGDEPL
jgi:hypothetical protein